MGAGEIIAIVIIGLIIGGAIFYIIKAKKSGRKCIGCPEGCSCAYKNGNGKNENSESLCSCCHKDK